MFWPNWTDKPPKNSPRQWRLIITTTPYYTGWWFQPIWTILVKMAIFPKFWGENKKSLKFHHPAYYMSGISPWPDPFKRVPSSLLSTLGSFSTNWVPSRKLSLATLQGSRIHIPPNGKFGKSSTQNAFKRGDICIYIYIYMLVPRRV